MTATVTKTVRKRRKYTPATLLVFVKDYVAAKQAVTTFNKRVTDTRDNLIAALEADGIADEAGHIWLDLSEPVENHKGGYSNRVKFQRAVKERLRPDDEVEKLLKRWAKDGKHRDDLLDACQTTITVLDEDKILALHAAGDLTEADLNKIYFEQEIWSVELP